MGTIAVFLAVLCLGVAVPTTDASSHSPWYCYRLAPQFITSALTPCTFPCLFISPNVHPHIVVQPELDGTPCHVAPSLHHKSQVAPSIHHETEVGQCRRGVCVVKLRPPVLKRKKRFVCLVTLAALLKARKERRKLQHQMEQLRRLAWYTNMGRVSRVTGRGVTNANLPTTRLNGAGSTGASTVNEPTIEIHLVPSGENGGTAAENSVRRMSTAFNSGSGISGSIPTITSGGSAPGITGDITNADMRARLRYRNPGHEGIGSPGPTGSNAGSPIFGEGIGRAGGGVAGSGAYTPGEGGVGNFGLGTNGRGGSFSGNSRVGAGVIGAGIVGSPARNSNGGGGVDVTVGNIAATTSRRTGDGRGSSTVVGVSGVRVTARGSGVGRNGGSGSLTNGGGENDYGGLAGVGGDFANRGTLDSNIVRAGAAAIGGTLLRRRFDAPRIGAASTAFTGTVDGVTRGNVGGSSSSAGATGFVTGNGLGGTSERNTYFGTDEEDNESSNRDSFDFDDDEPGERRSTYDRRFRG